MCCGCQSSVVEGLAQQHALIGLVHTTDFISGYDSKIYFFIKVSFFSSILKISAPINKTENSPINT